MFKSASKTRHIFFYCRSHYKIHCRLWHIKTSSAPVTPDAVSSQNLSDYDVKWTTSDDYQLVRILGRGRYSHVFEAIKEPEGTRCALKILLPVKEQRLNREAKVLLTLKGGVNIVTLLATVKSSNCKALVFEYDDHVDFRGLCLELSDVDVKYYMLELLKALEYSHSHGIMHRDLKPNNIIVNHSKRKLLLIDWGLSEFYHPGEEYNVRVASRYFKAPELLLENHSYDYSIDIWSFGCILAGILFKKEPFFKGTSTVDQLVRITHVLGTKVVYAYAKKHDIELSDAALSQLGECAPEKWESLLPKDGKHFVTKEAVDLLKRLLKFDPENRLTAKLAMEHSYFSIVQ